jgi:hypothetical protein
MKDAILAGELGAYLADETQVARDRQIEAIPNHDLRPPLDALPDRRALEGVRERGTAPWKR